jgi:putative spermidine/putrescine transport system permease protein
MRIPIGMKVLGTLIYIFILLPIAFVVWISFFKSPIISIPPTGYTVSWYANLHSQSDMMSSLGYSLEIAFLAMIISVIIAFLGSLAIARSKNAIATTAETLFLLPLSVPAIVTGMGLFVYFFALSLVIKLGQVPSFWMLLAGHVVITLPWSFRLIYAGIASVDQNLERAGLDLGYNEWQTFLKVTLPLLRPSVVAGAIFAFIISFGTLEISLFLVAPGSSTLPVAILNYAYWKVDPTIAAVATIEMAVVGVLMVIADRVVGLSNAFNV